jgi:hypothetical protein
MGKGWQGEPESPERDRVLAHRHDRRPETVLCRRATDPDRGSAGDEHHRKPASQKGGEMTSEPDDFERIYLAVYDEVYAELGRQGVDTTEIFLEPASVTQFNFMAIPRAELLAIPSDEEFVEAVAYKILDRVIGKQEKITMLGWLESGVSREQLLDRKIDDYRQFSVSLGPL